MKITTQARRIARWSNEHGDPGHVYCFNADGRYEYHVCGPAGGASLKPHFLAQGYRLYRTSHGKDKWRDVQAELDSQSTPPYRQETA